MTRFMREEAKTKRADAGFKLRRAGGFCRKISVKKAKPKEPEHETREEKGLGGKKQRVPHREHRIETLVQGKKGEQKRGVLIKRVGGALERQVQ